MTASGLAAASTLRLVAVHEAGHAVAAHLMGLHLAQLEIVGDGELAGSCHTLRLLADRTPAGIRLLVACAGPVAEAMERGGAWDEDTHDLDVAVRLALGIAGDCEAAHRLLEVTADRARHLLARHWHAGDGIARALQRRRRLGSGELDALLAALVDP